MAAVLLAGKLDMAGSLAAPIAVGLGATLIVLSSKVPMLETIPASVYGFAAIAGLILVGSVPAQDALIPTILSVIIGAVFGYVSEIVADALAKKPITPAEAATTPAS